MRRAIWTVGLTVSAVAGIAVTGLVGLVSSAGLIMAGPEAAEVARVAPAPAPRHDSSRPTVAVLLGDTRTEATDFLAPYAMFAESQAYNVYAVADSRDLRTLAGGVDVVPHLTFAELAARVPDGPDVIVVPAIEHIESPANAPVLDWLRRHDARATFFSWCVGAEVLAAAGLIDGRPVTTHWGDIDGLERAYPAPRWQRGVRYVDDGDLLTTGGITAGVDATLHFLETRNGRAVADRVAAAIRYRSTMFVDDPRAAQYTTQPVDAAVYLNLAFKWPKPNAAIWLYEGVGEVDLASAVEVFGVTSASATTTVAATSTVMSEHGLQIAPRRQAHEAAPPDRVLVPGGTGAGAAAREIPAHLLAAGRPPTILEREESPTYAFTVALEELAASHDVLTAEYAARQLEVRSPLDLAGPALPGTVLLVPVLAAVASCLALWGLVTLGRLVMVRRERVGLVVRDWPRTFHSIRIVGLDRPLRRAVIATVFIGGHIAVGFAFGLGAEAYLLLGIPTTIAFQALVVRRPLRALWLQAAPPMAFTRRSTLAVVAVAIVPAVLAIRGAQHGDPILAAYGLVAMFGAVGAVYALRAMNREAVGSALRASAINAALLVAVMVTFRLLSGGFHGNPGAAAATTVVSLATYLPAVFVMEEVLFRGLLDPYLHGSTPGPDRASAVYGSALWGLWHLPVMSVDLGLLTIPYLVAIHSALGYVLVSAWRRTGNLGAPGIAHAVADALRNAVAVL